MSSEAIPTSPSANPPRSASSAAEDLQATLRATLARLQRAQREKGAASYEARLSQLARIEELLLKNQDEIAESIRQDFGNRAKAESLLAEVFTVVEGARHARANLHEWMAAEEKAVHWALWPARAEVRYQPLGVVGIIAPWNYPVNLAFGPLVGAFAAGNRAMLKPSELTPRTAMLLEKMVRDNFAEDELAVVQGGPEVAEAFSRLPFDHLLFTGSTRVGRAVMRAAAENLTPVTLELGGKSPAIIGEQYDVGDAAAKILFGKCFNAGQTCIAPDYVLVPEFKAGAFVEGARKAVAKMFPRLADNADFTSVVSDRHYARLQGLLEDARAKGARIVELNPAGETLDPASRKIAPTLILEATEEMHVMQEELFGPLLPVRTYGALTEAIDYVNDHPRPLALYFFDHSEANVERVLEQTVAGGVCINETLLHFAQDELPFGGVGDSGMGAYHGHDGFLTFSKKKPIVHQSRVTASTMLRPPYGSMMKLTTKLLLPKPGRGR